jgi:hypothetical protein
MLIKNSFLYVTGTNFVFRLNSPNINDTSSEFYKERLIYPTILNELNGNEEASIQNKNYVKFMSARQGINDLIVCGTNLGKPHVYDLKETDLSNQLEYNGNYLCPYLANYSSLGLISFDVNFLKHQAIKKGIMFSAIWLTETPSQTHGVFSRYGIFRKEIEFNRFFLRSHPSPAWLWEPEFVAILEDSFYVYYFFTEYSIEEFGKSLNIRNLSNIKNESLMRHSRVARVCKNDKGMKSDKYPFLNNLWSSFRKIKIECGCHNGIVFNNLVLIKRIGKQLIGIFYHSFVNGEGFSILCEFELNDLGLKLNTRKFRIGRNEPVNAKNLKFYDSDSGCEQNLNENSEKIEELNDDMDTDYGSSSDRKDLDDYYLFLSENTILENKLVGVCKLKLEYNINTLSTENSGSKDLYLTSTDGDIIKISKINNKYQILSIFKIEKDIKINQVLINQASMYLATSLNHYQLDLNRLKQISCNKNEFCEACNNEPDCLWELNNKAHCVYYANKTQSRKSKCNKSTVLKKDSTYELNQSLALKCLDVDNRIRGNDDFLNQISWFKDDADLDKFNLSYRTTKLNELILLNMSHSNFTGVYSCKLNKSVDLININLTLASSKAKSEINSNQSIALETSISLLKGVLDECKSEMNNYQTRLNEYKNLFFSNNYEFIDENC